MKTKDQIIKELGLMPFREFRAKTVKNFVDVYPDLVYHYGYIKAAEMVYRRSGRTTETIVDALYESQFGSPVYIISKTSSQGERLLALANSYAKLLGIDSKFFTLTYSNDIYRWLLGERVLKVFYDHYCFSEV